MSGVLLVEAAAVPVPIFAVQSGDARTPWEELVVLALVVPLLVTLLFVTSALAAWPVPMAADQWSLAGSFDADSVDVDVRSRDSRMRFPRTVSKVRCSVAAVSDVVSSSEVRLYRAKTVSASAVGNSQRFEMCLPLEG